MGKMAQAARARGKNGESDMTIDGAAFRFLLLIFSLSPCPLLARRDLYLSHFVICRFVFISSFRLHILLLRRISCSTDLICSSEKWYLRSSAGGTVTAGSSNLFDLFGGHRRTMRRHMSAHNAGPERGGGEDKRIAFPRIDEITWRSD